MEPIETEYKGYRFRSRLEARWAVFLDELGAEWNYEPQGFRFDGGEKYLPDFWVESWDCWVEVKGPTPSENDKKLAYLLANGSGSPVVLAHGQFKLEVDEVSGMDSVSPHCHVFYGDTQQAFDYLFPYHESQDSHPVSVSTIRTPIDHMLDLCTHLRRNDYEIKYTHDAETVQKIISLDEQYWEDEYGGQHPKWEYGWVRPQLHASLSEGGVISKANTGDKFPKLKMRAGPAPKRIKSEAVRNAYHSAQSARFEHGEVGAL